MTHDREKLREALGKMFDVNDTRCIMGVIDAHTAPQAEPAAEAKTGVDFEGRCNRCGVQVLLGGPGGATIFDVKKRAEAAEKECDDWKDAAHQHAHVAAVANTEAVRYMKERDQLGVTIGRMQEERAKANGDLYQLRAELAALTTKPLTTFSEHEERARQLEATVQTLARLLAEKSHA